MALDPQARAYLDQIAALHMPDVPSLSPDEARVQMELGALMLGKAPAVGRVEDRTVPGPGGPIRVRLTHPTDTGSGGAPGLVYFHGGGWVVGSVASHDNLCRTLTAMAGVAVVSVEYRLAPEHPFPAAADDAEAATTYVSAHAGEFGIDPARLAVGGDSAGGNLAAVAALRLRGRLEPPLALQVLLYPITDAGMDTDSYDRFADGHLLTRDAMNWYWGHYAPDTARRFEPDASPLRAADLSGLPPALVVTAGHDPLRDEGEAYARRLAGFGVPVRLSCYEGMIHGFLRRHAQFDQGKVALGEVASALREVLGA